MHGKEGIVTPLRTGTEALIVADRMAERAGFLAALAGEDVTAGRANVELFVRMAWVDGWTRGQAYLRLNGVVPGVPCVVAAGA